MKNMYRWINFNHTQTRRLLNVTNIHHLRRKEVVKTSRKSQTFSPLASGCSHLVAISDVTVGSTFPCCHSSAKCKLHYRLKQSRIKGPVQCDGPSSVSVLLLLLERLFTGGWFEQTTCIPDLSGTVQLKWEVVDFLSRCQT